MSSGKKLTLEEFILRAEIIHNCKYDYSKSIYINNKTKLCIICPKHGIFYQRPDEHLKGSGCKKCKYEKPYNKLNTKQFIDKAKKIFPQYDYSLCEYITIHDKVKIICPTHGVFEISPNNLLNKHGCAKCTNELKSIKKLKSQSQFIKECNKIHNYKYDYSFTKYKGGKFKIKIKCPIHGFFYQRASDHLFNKQGCPKCNISKLEKEIENLLIKNNILFEYQKRFKWLKKQSLDFYLPEYNIGIECLGQQHFVPIDHFGGILEYNKICNRDINKYNLCKNNNIKILYYTDKNYNYFEKLFISKNDLLKEILQSYPIIKMN